MDLLFRGVEPVKVGAERLEGLLGVPDNPKGLVIFAHGSGSSRLSPRNNEVAAHLREAGLATLLLDLLKPEEEADRGNVFDIELLAMRLVSATGWAETDHRLENLKVGYFGASTGAAAALVAAAQLGRAVSAIVSRGGRPDLAGDALEYVRAPTLLIVGGADLPVIPLNRLAFEHLRTKKDIAIVKNAGHLFEEPGAMAEVVDLAREWFLRFLPKTEFRGFNSFTDRVEAGTKLGQALAHLKEENPVVLALPRGGVPVAFEVAKALNAPLDVALVRKIGAPGQPELGLGALVDGTNPKTVYNEEVVRLVRPTETYLKAEEGRQLAELERRRALYRRDREPIEVKDRTVIVIDDGIATGGTMRAVLQALRSAGVKKLVLAVPVAPDDTLDELSTLADETVCLATPEPFYAVGAHYKNFDQTSDEEVIDLLARAMTR
ncbi:MAG TPA: phosphoribosyltransferase [Micropepsaceae bacterium]|nr:phosphoribosyltransferase [Micropepsaceae bacterium]